LQQADCRPHDIALRTAVVGGRHARESDASVVIDRFTNWASAAASTRGNSSGIVIASGSAIDLSPVGWWSGLPWCRTAEPIHASKTGRGHQRQPRTRKCAAPPQGEMNRQCRGNRRPRDDREGRQHFNADAKKLMACAATVRRPASPIRATCFTAEMF